MANESENPLDDLSPDEQQALKQLAEKRASKSVGRRDALKTGGALSIGALIGGGSAATAIDTASADASTSDSDGDVGEPGDRVDVFADGVDATTAALGKLTQNLNANTYNITNAGKLGADEQSISQISAVLEKTSDQSISANTDTTIDWDNQDLDSNLYNYDGTNDELEVLAAGDYAIRLVGRIDNISDQDLLQGKIVVNGTFEKAAIDHASGTTGRWGGSVLLKDLAANDKIRIDYRTGTSGTIAGSSSENTAMINKVG